MPGRPGDGIREGPPTRPLRAVLASSLIFFGLPHCAWLHSVDEAPAPRLALPAEFKAATHSSTSAAPAWTDFSDPGLRTLLDTLDATNLDIRQAGARLRAADAAVDAAGASFWPSLGFDGSAARVQTNLGPTNRFQANRFSLRGSASYELDLWGRNAAAHSAEAALRDATAWDLRTAQVTVRANLAETWFALAAEFERQRTLEAQIEAREARLKLLSLKYRRGLVPALDVHQERQQLAAVRAEYPLSVMRRRVFTHQLAELMGQSPTAWTLPSEPMLPPPPDLPRVDLPAQMVARRPDVRAAQARVVAQDHRVGAALANRFPILSLNASGGWDGFDLATLFENWVWSLAANITGTLFDGGRRAHEQTRQEAELEAALLAYTKTVLVALREVDDLWVQSTAQADHLARLADQQDAAERTLKEAEARYRRGLSDYLPVLAARNTLDTVRLRTIEARRELLSYRIKLWRALGVPPRSAEPPIAQLDSEPTPP